MGRSLLFLAGVVFALVFAAGTSESDVAVDTASPVDEPTILSGTPEPTLQTATTNAPGDETVHKDPFTLFSAEGGVPYEELSVDDKAGVDRLREIPGQRQQNDAFAQAVREQSVRARAEAAQHQLGLEALDQIGVVP
jgi:hypothetical protein